MAVLLYYRKKIVLFMKMKYEEWLKEVPAEIKEDTLWSLTAYRSAFFLAESCWDDTKQIRVRHLYSLADQLYRSVGSIGANVAKGYFTHSPKEQARFYEIALGSTRESKEWYFKSRHILGAETVTLRLQLLATIVR